MEDYKNACFSFEYVTENTQAYKQTADVPQTTVYKISWIRTFDQRVWWFAWNKRDSNGNSVKSTNVSNQQVAPNAAFSSSNFPDVGWSVCLRPQKPWVY